MESIKELSKWVAYREDLPFLLNKLGLKGTGAEIGVEKGIFSKHLLEHWHGEKLYLIDCWRHNPEYNDIANGDHNIQLDNMAKTFMAVYEHSKRAAIIREFSVDAATLFQDSSLDFVFLDADHSYSAVKNDIGAWFPKVKKGGLLCGHDYLDSSYQERKPEGPYFTESGNRIAEFGVKSAVDEWAAKYSKEVMYTANQLFPFWWTQI